MKKILSLLVFFMFGLNVFAFNEIRKDTKTMNTISTCLDKLYNHEFTAAQKYIDIIKVNYSDHPVYQILQCQKLLFHLPYSNQKAKDEASYLEKLEIAISQCETTLKTDKDNIEAKFFALSGYGYKSLYYSDRGQMMKAASIAKKAFGYMKEGFELQTEFNEFYFTSGLYHYYAVQYPETHPIVKPIMWFFPNGSKTKGLAELKVAAAQTKFSYIEASFYVGHLLSKYEMKTKEALTYFKKLHTNYPNNYEYTLRYIETLMFEKQYSTAYPIIQKMKQNKSLDFQNAALVMEGWYYERAQKNYSKAKTNYLKAIELINDKQINAKEFKYFAHIGLGRIYASENKSSEAHEQYKIVSSTSQYELLKKEANDYLSTHKKN